MNQKSEVNISRRYYCSQEKLWRALMEGHLFFFTGAMKDKSTFDMKVGGKLHLEWNDSKIKTDGEFLEITPQSRIVFSWDTSSAVYSKVFVDIKNVGDYCELNLRHEFAAGTGTKEYDWGWDDSMYDLKKFLYKD